MYKMPHMEINVIPSALNTSQPTGVASQLAQVAGSQPEYDGVTIEQMRGNPVYGRGDVIDKIGLAQKAIADAAKILKGRAKYIRALNDASVKMQKPTAKN